MRAVWELLFPSRVAVVCATEVNATLLYGKFDIEGLFVEIRLPFSPIVPLIKQYQQKRQFWWLFSYYGHLATKSWAEITKSQAALEMSVYACQSHGDVIQESIWICTLRGARGQGGERNSFWGVWWGPFVASVCCCFPTQLLWYSNPPLSSTPEITLNRECFSFTFTWTCERLPVISEGLCDKNKGNLMYCTWTHSFTVLHLKPLLQILTVWISTRSHPSDASALVLGTL